MQGARQIPRAGRSGSRPLRIAITGATGYLGEALARRLTKLGHQVVALVRPSSRLEALETLGVATYPGDITDRFSMRQALAGADWVIHAAAEIDLTSPEPVALERMQQVNVVGSENVASLCYKLGIGRLLSVSSVATFGGSPDDGSAADEDSPLRPPVNAYGATKRGAEQVIQRWAEQGLRVNTVYPSLIYGLPGRRGGANPLLAAAAEGRLKVLAGAQRRLGWLHLDDAVEGIVQVMEKAEPGRSFLLAGEIAPLGSVLARVCRLAGSEAPRWHLPVSLARRLAAVTAPFLERRGHRRPFGPGALLALQRHWAFDDRRARQELGWEPRSLEQGLTITVPGLLARGSAPPPSPRPA